MSKFPQYPGARAKVYKQERYSEPAATQIVRKFTISQGVAALAAQDIVTSPRRIGVAGCAFVVAPRLAPLLLATRFGSTLEMSSP